MKVIIISNCQCKPLGAAWSAMRPTDDVQTYELYRLLGKPAEIAGAVRRMDLADIIIYNPISEDYPVREVRESYIKSFARAERIAIPNFFFEGLHPDIRYIGTSERRVHSPMGDYNSRIVLRSFLRGLSVERAIEAFGSELEYENLGYYDRWQWSLDELNRRDERHDIAGASIVHRYVSEQPSFFTVNHPTNIIMKDLSQRIMKLLSLSFTDVPLEYIAPTLANGPVWPIFSWVARHHGLKYPAVSILKSDQGGAHILGVEDFVKKSYYIYARSAEFLLETPQVRSELAELRIDLGDIMEAIARGEHRGINGGLRLNAVAQPAGNIVNIPKLIRYPLFHDSAERSSTVSGSQLPEMVWINPADANAIRQQAREMLAAGNTIFFNEAIHFLEMGLLADPGIHGDLSDLYVNAGMTEKAMECATAWVNASPKDGAAWTLLARLQRSHNATREAFIAAITGLEVAPDMFVCHLLVAHLLMDLDMPSAAVAQVVIMNRRFGEDPHNMALMGFAYGRMGIWQSAIIAYEASVKAAPEFEPFADGLFNALTRGGRPDEALALCERQVLMRPTSDVWKDRKSKLLSETATA